MFDLEKLKSLCSRKDIYGDLLDFHLNTHPSIISTEFGDFLKFGSLRKQDLYLKNESFEVFILMENEMRFLSISINTFIFSLSILERFDSKYNGISIDFELINKDYLLLKKKIETINNAYWTAIVKELKEEYFFEQLCPGNTIEVLFSLPHSKSDFLSKILNSDFVLLDFVKLEHASPVADGEFECYNGFWTKGTEIIKVSLFVDCLEKINCFSISNLSDYESYLILKKEKEFLQEKMHELLGKDIQFEYFDTI